jgi:DNA invertase Pin-like site-specific DNA recombinase
MIIAREQLEATRRGRPRAANPKRAVAYLRVSTEEQHNGPDAQRDAIEVWAASNGIEVVAWYEDHGVSGGAPLDQRPELLAAIEAVKDYRAGVLVVAKRDRLARDAMVAALVERLVERSGAHLRSADNAGNGDGPEAKLLRTMIDAFAEYERALIKLRTRSALAAKKRRGERTGGLPFGMRLSKDGVHLERDPVEGPIVDRVLTMRKGGATFREIVETLNAERVRAARGARWHMTTVQRICARD